MDLLARIPGGLAFCLALSAPLPLSLACARGASGGPAAAPGRFLAAAVCWCYCQAALGTVMGALGLFRPGWMAAAQAALFAAGLAWPRGPGSAAPPGPRAPADGIMRALLCLPALAALLLLRDVLIWPPVESDTLGYHLPLLFKLIQEGRFAYLGHWDFQEHFPRAWETLSAVLCLPRRRDTLALAPNVLAFAVFGAAITALARRSGAGRAPALAAAALALLSPILAGHVGSLHVDLPFAAFFLAALHFARGYAESRSAPQGVCLAMAAALCAGIRGTALPYLALLALLLWGPGPLPGSMRNAQSADAASPLPLRSRTSRLLRAAAALALLLPGLYWYARNYVLAGNPFYGIRIDLFGHTLFPGAYPSADLAATSLARNFHPLAAGQARILAGLVWTHFGLAFPALGLPALWALAGRARPDRPRAPFWLALAAAGTLAIYATTPFSGIYNSPRIGLSPNTGAAFRLGFPFWGLLAALGAVGWTRPKAKDGLLLALAATAFALWVRGNGTLLIGAAALIALGLWSGSRRGLAAQAAPGRVWARLATARRRAGLAGASALALAAIAAALPRAEASRDANRSKREYGPAAAFLDAAPNRGAAVAFAAADHSYALFGADLDHRVEYRPPGDRAIPAWAGALRREGFAWVAIGPCSLCPADGAAALRRALEGDTADFAREFGAAAGGGIALYRLAGGRDGASASARLSP